MTENTSTNATQMLFAKIGQSLPDRKRVKGSRPTRINIEPTGMIKITHTLGTSLKGKVDTTKNSLEGKKLVLFIGSESHALTRVFYKPKLAMMYDFMTKEDSCDVEFLYVSLDESKEAFDRFTATMPWPCVSWEDKDDSRSKLEAIYYKSLKKKANGMCAVVVLDSDHSTVISKDSVYGVGRTHCETGKDFPWVASTAENCCAGATGLVFCSIM